jgi:hypothetical protein
MEGAVNRPVAVIVPALACHVTAVLLVPVTVAVNCVAAESAEFAEGGDTLTDIAGGGDVTSVTIACADLVVSATLVAIMVTVGLGGITAGAVYKPDVLIIPALACHVTAVLLVPVKEPYSPTLASR